MDDKDLMLQLVQLLQNNGSKSSVCMMPDREFAANATEIKDDSILCELRKYLNNRLELAFLDKSKANAFLLIPYSKTQWKVFVVDRKGSPYVQLDDFMGEIKINNENPNTNAIVVYSKK